jgi:hypothetical protein
MADFVNRELWTADWLRALSFSDAAAQESLRRDYGCTGAFDAWFPLTAEQCFGQAREQALARLQSVEAVTGERPLGQAHLVANDGYSTRKAVSMDYCGWER